MARHAVHHERPGHIGLLAPELAVDEIADSHRQDADARQWRGEVEHIGDLALAAYGKDRKADHHADQSAVE
jgi:hypothetical protein